MKDGVFSWLNKLSTIPLIKFLFVKDVKGWENIPKRNFILVSNHQSYLDLYIDAGFCAPKRFHFIGQVDSWKGIPGFFIKTYYKMAGVIPLDRNKQDSRKKVIEKSVEVLKRGEILIMYPEGTRSKNGELQEGKLGVAKIFLKTGVPILPVGIKGTFELMPPHGKLKIKKTARVNIGKPLYFEKEFEDAKSLKEDSEEYLKILKKITSEIMSNIAELIQKT
jgi:1-acyl-sn-glycerol-3-phosphate acyltransferase